MALEIAPYINSLDAANPTALDLKSQGDDHIRLLKSAIKATFPAITAPVTKTAAQLNADYGPGNVVGLVSQSLGAPTGAAMETGSNANGSYTRFADGTQICTISVTLAQQAINTPQSVVKTLPASFIDTTYAVAFSIRSSLGGANQQAVGQFNGNGIYFVKGTSTVTFSSYSYRETTSDGVILEATITGRWF